MPVTPAPPPGVATGSTSTAEGVRAVSADRDSVVAIVWHVLLVP